MRDPSSRRQYHKKSRQGCSACICMQLRALLIPPKKRRHVKCDEQGPPCANCRVRKEECDYGLHAERLPSPQDSRLDSGSGSYANRKLELELIHHWSTDTYRSLVFHPDNENLWKVTIPRTALDQDYLLNAILAMSSLHFSTLSTASQSMSYQLAALRYHNLAFAAFQADDRTATMENHQSLFAFSIINLVLAVALPSCLDRDIDSSSILDNLSTMSSLLQGTTSIYRFSRTWLMEGPFGNYLRSNAEARVQIEDLDPYTVASFEQLRALRDEEYATISSSAEIALDAVRTHEITTAAIDELETCFRIQYEDKMVVCFRWLSMLDEGFTLKIRNREPLALLITMYWAVLLDGLSREKWWAESSGKALVAEISKILWPCKPEWIPILSSVHQQVGLPPLSPR